MSFFLRLTFGDLLTVMGVKEGDYRDWNAIRAWAGTLDQKLVQKQY